MGVEMKQVDGGDILKANKSRGKTPLFAWNLSELLAVL
jgi:hypothetical protein